MSFVSVRSENCGQTGIVLNRGEGNMSSMIAFAGIINARDLDGLTTTEGETIRKGLLLRAANLSLATKADLAKLRQDYRLSSIIDLHTAVERKEKPDRIPEDGELRIHPIFDEAPAGITREDNTSIDSGTYSIISLVLFDLYQITVPILDL